MLESELFPAYAGVIPLRLSLFMEPRAFPRICGGDPYLLEPLDKLITFSPHMRG